MWNDNPYTDTSELHFLFDTIKENSQYTIIIIAPKSKTHYLITTTTSKSPKENLKPEQLYFNTLFCQSYYLNVHDSSCKRYLVNYMIFVCDWFFYMTKDFLPIYSVEQEENAK